MQLYSFIVALLLGGLTLRSSFTVSRITFKHNSQCPDPVVLSVLILRNFLEISSENLLERSCCFNASLMVLAELPRSRFSLGVEIRLLILTITRKWSESTLAPRKAGTAKTFDACLASIAMWYCPIGDSSAVIGGYFVQTIFTN